jgi:outer membrane lipoprotein SlyB
MNMQCLHCGQINVIPDNSVDVQYRCYHCGAFLPKPVTPNTDASQAVGLIGGAVLGGAIGGPVGALIGAVIGAVIGREAKTDG